MAGRLMVTGRRAGHGTVVAVAVVLALSLTDTPTVVAQVESGGLTPGRQGNSGYFVSELIDSTYFVGPAEFFALDLPASMRGAAAVHVFGEISVLGSGKRDIIVRLFRAAEYQNWLKRRGGVKSKAFWSSSRARTVKIDQNIPAGTPVVLLLDNGYSIRTPKRVRAQIQLHFQEGSGVPTDLVQERTAPVPQEPEEGKIVPRENTEEEVAPPPPPPPTE